MLDFPEDTPTFCSRKSKITAVHNVITRSFDVSKADLLSMRRNKSVLIARHWGMFLMISQFGVSQTQVGRSYGGRDHQTVRNAMDNIERMLKSTGPDGDAARRQYAELVRDLNAEGVR